jgi:glucuronokinase
MIIATRAYARAGLIGNPSDGYFGKTISFVIRNFAAQVTLYESPELCIEPHHKDHSVFNSIQELVDDVYYSGYYGGIRLIKATIKRFYEYTRAHHIELPSRNFTIRYDTTIPLRVGLAGSSGIIAATLRALMQFYGVTIEKQLQPSLILSVERDELGISAGLQDRVIQVYEGVVFMDFRRDHMEEHGFGIYEELDPALLPPLFVAFQENLSEGTEVFHNDVRQRWDMGDPEVREAMEQFARCAEQFRHAMLTGDRERMFHLINQNFDIRAGFYPISEQNWRLVNTARNIGACAKFCGSGGAVVGIFDGPRMLDELERAYSSVGARLIIPQIV